MQEKMCSNNITYHDNSKFFDLFKELNKPNQQHPYFNLLNTSSAYSSAKEAIKEISYHYKDIDGNFIDQFQSINGFDSRIWELYLFCFFKEQYFYFNREHEAPDYIVEKDNTRLAVEAVIVSRKNSDFTFKKPKTSKEMNTMLKDEVPLMISNVIYDKVKKKYWEKEHVKGIPFTLAIADFHDSASMIWTYEAFFTCLYGIKPELVKDQTGNLSQDLKKINIFTKKNGTQIPAGLFFQPGYENISAIIYNPTATLSKFNRMGRQAGLGSDESIITWTAAFHDHTEGALLPIMKSQIITEDCSETWSMGATIFHNPNAKIPISPDLFSEQVAHINMIDGQLINLIPKIHPYHGFVLNQIKSKDEINEI
ncbi:glycosaminoglycan attachment site [Myroides odoratimimus]|uniref:glycosaminoglycan attachment site n=1 Tax=Myroides odoratimimus TaxID=76832 RepID=UPI0011152031|nr:glycosaminoglycan attachment site [Myroides odoratimimus]